MNSVDAFSAQVGNYLAPTWPAAVQAPSSPVAAQAAPASSGYWYPIAGGNPQSLTVVQVVSQAYGLDPVRDSAQIQQMASYVAQQNNLFLVNFPIPSSVTGLRLPWPPRSNGGQRVKKKSSFNLGSLLAGVAAAAAGVGQIFLRHSGNPGGAILGGLSTGMPGGAPVAPPTQAQMIAADIGDGLPALADLAAGIAGQPLPQTYSQPYGQSYPQGYGYPQQPTAPYIPQQVGAPYPQQPYPAQPYSPAPYPGPAYPESTFSTQSASSWGAIASSVGSLAQTFGQIFGSRRH